MAQGTRRDVELALSVSTANAESLRQLRDTVRSLAKEGGDAAPEFQRLAEELDALSQQAKQLGGLEALKGQLDGAKVSQEALAATSNRLKEEVRQLGVTTEDYRLQQRNMAAELERARLAAQQTGDQIKVLRATTAEADRGTAAYKAQMEALNATYLEQRDLVRKKRADLTELNLTVKDAAAEQAKAGKAYREAAAETAAATREVNRLRETYDNLTTKLIEAGAQTTDVAEATKKVQDSYLLAQRAVRQYVDEQERATQAAREAAREEERLAAIQEGARKALMAQAKAEADGIIRDYERMEQAQREAAKASEEAARRMTAALKSTGAGAARDLEAQINEVRQAMEYLRQSGNLTGAELARAMAQGNARIKELERDLREATGQMTLMDRAAGALKTTVGQLAAFVGLAEVVQRTATAFLDANKQIEALRLGLSSVYGSTQIAAQQIEFLRATADRAGVAVGEISSTFIKFAASTKESNIPLSQSNALFEELTRVSGVLGLSSVKVNQALEAVSQIAAKGTLSLEELRQQLGDALPAATALAARGLGYTQEEMFKLIEAGQITAQEFIPAFTEALKTIEGESNTLTAVLARLSNAITEALQNLGDTGLVDALKTALEGLTAVVRFLGDNMQGLSAAVLGLGQAFLAVKFVQFLQGLGSVAAASRAAALETAKETAAVAANTAAQATNTAALATNTAAKRANAAATAASTAANAAAGGAIGTVLGGALTLATGLFKGLASAARVAFAAIGGFPGVILAILLNIKELGTWLGEGAAKLMGYGDAIKNLEEQWAAEAEASKQAAAEREAAARREAQLIKQGLAERVKSREAAEGEVAVAVKATEAAKKRMDAVNQLANAYADETMKQRDSASAATAYAATADAEAAKRRNVVVELEREVAQRQLAINAANGSTQAMRDEQQAAEELLAKKREEAAEAAERSKLAQIEAQDRRLVAQTYQDNSDKVDGYRQAMLAAEEGVKALYDSEGNLLATEDQLFAARLRLREATTLYNDALSDSERKVNSIAAAKQAEINMDRAGLQVKLETARRSEANARAQGNEREAIKAKIEQKKIEQQLAILSIRAAETEVNARIKNAQKTLEEKEATGELTAEKRRELETLILTEKVKLKELEARGVNVKAIGDEITNMERQLNLLGSTSNASRDAANAKGDETRGRNANADAIQREIDRLKELQRLYGRPGGGGGGGEEGGKGPRNPYARPEGGSIVGNTREERLKGQSALDMTKQFELRDKMNARKLTEADLPDLLAVIESMKVNEATDREVMRLNPGAFSAEGMADVNKWAAIRRRFEQQAAVLQGAGNVAKTVKVDITTNGKGKRTVNTDAEGANNIANLMRELEAASGRATR